MSTDATTITEPALAERERVIRLLRAHEHELRALRVTRLALFGSMARGEARRKSDVDIVIHVPPDQKFSLFDLGEVRVELCKLLGRDVGIVIDDDLRPEFRQRIAGDRIEVF